MRSILSSAFIDTGNYPLERNRFGLLGALSLIACLVFLLAPNTCWFLVTGKGGGAHEVSGRALQGALGLIFVLLALLRWCPRFVGVLAGACAIPATLAAWYVVTFGAPADINVLSLIAETGVSEAGDLLASLPLWVWGGTLCAIPATICAVVLKPTIPRGWPAKALALLGLGMILLLIMVAREPKGVEPGEGEASDLPADASPSTTRSALLASYPLGLPLLLNDYWVSRRVISAAIARRHHQVFGSRLETDSRTRLVYVFVIGETGRGSRWQLNGYGRETNPLLSKRDDVIAFGNMTTPFVYTRLSVPAMLTRAGTRDSSRFNEGSLVSAFKEAGFRTAWISMQAPLGFHESMVSSYAAEADYVRFLNPSDYSTHGFPDMKAVDALMEYVYEQPDDAKLFIVLHTLGSHFRYTDRYPLRDAWFKPDRTADHQVSLYDPADAVYLSNAYDNSVRYTDRVLNSLFDRLEKIHAQSWVYYSADHGEALFDGCDGTAGHGQFNEQTQSVAAIFWASSEYKKQQASRMRNLRRRSALPLSTIMTFETLSGLGGLWMPKQRPGYDFSADGEVAVPPAMVHADCELSGRDVLSQTIKWPMK
jgi:glucan phosphoethanolaminetransferase (alkaline phosphatase superfamily)